MTYGWKGKQVRHKDGRTGKILAEEGIGPALTLNIGVEGGDYAAVVLCANSQDGGEQGWEWFCDNFEGGARWLPLGDHNGPEKQMTTEEICDVVTGYVDGYFRVKYATGMSDELLQELLLNNNIEKCVNCGQYTDSFNLLDDGEDDPDGFCDNCRAYDKKS